MVRAHQVLHHLAPLQTVADNAVEIVPVVAFRGGQVLVANAHHLAQLPPLHKHGVTLFGGGRLAQHLVHADGGVVTGDMHPAVGFRVQGEVLVAVLVHALDGTMQVAQLDAHFDGFLRAGIDDGPEQFRGAFGAPPGIRLVDRMLTHPGIDDRVGHLQHEGLGQHQMKPPGAEVLPGVGIRTQGLGDFPLCLRGRLCHGKSCRWHS